MSIKMESDLEQTSNKVKIESLLEQQRQDFRMESISNVYSVKCKEETYWESQEDMSEDSSCPPESTSQCSAYRKCFAQRQNLVKKECIHTSEQPCRCTQCEKSFIEKHNPVKQHRLHNVLRLYSYEIGERGFSLKHNLTTHQKVHTGEKPYPCTLCSRNPHAYHINHNEQKIPQVKSEFQVNCDDQERIASEINLTQESWDNGAQKDATEAVVNREFGLSARPFICPQCGKRFANKMVFVIHYRMHTGQRPFPCPQCNQRFVQKQHLIKHLRVHTGERPYSCSHCGKCFSTRYKLLSHRKVHTGGKPYICFDCGKRFMHRSTYRFHKRIHSKWRPQTLHNSMVSKKKYSQNKKITLRKNSLINHMLVPRKLSHRGRAFRCNICAKSFTYRHVLVNHMRIHSGERPFPCKVCGMKFIQKSHLTKHFRLHTGEKPYTCPLCKKSFTIKHNLTTHQRIHTGEKPYSCTECTKAFSRKAALKKHQATHRAAKVEPHTGKKDVFLVGGLIATQETEAVVSGCKNSAAQDGVRVLLDHTYSLCSQRFSDNVSLHIHQQNLVDGEGFQAFGINGKSVLQKPVLIQNPSQLIGEKPYTGDLYNLVIYSISQNTETVKPIQIVIPQATRVQAILIHSRDRPYTCHKCSKSYTQKKHLKRHLKTHSLENP